MLRSRKSGWIYCPGSLGQIGRPLRNDRETFLALNRRAPTLFLALTAEGLEPGAAPGATTFFSPSLPSRSRECLRTASALLTGDLSAGITALLNNVPVVFLASHPSVETWARRLEVPLLLSKDAKQIVADFENAISRFPWAKVKRRLEVHRHSLSRIALPGIPAVKIERSNALLPIAVITDGNYLPHLHGLMENVRSVHGGPVEWHVLTLDAESRRLLKPRAKRENIIFYDLKTLWNFERTAHKQIAARSVAHQAYSSKAALLLAALKKAQGPVLFLDTDVFLFRSPARLLGELGTGSTLLFPQWNDSLSHARLHGLFNTGMMVVAPGAEPFLRWWRDLCLLECSPDTARGFFIDQGFVDLAPLYFEGLRIYRDGDENIGKWNLETLEVTVTDEVPRLGSGRPLGSFHAAIADPLGLYEAKATWDQWHWFLWQGSGPPPALDQMVLLQQRRHWPSLRALYAAHSLVLDRFGIGRFGIRLPGISPARLSPFYTPLGTKLIRRSAKVYSSARAIKRHFFPGLKSLISPLAKWPAIQRKLIFGDRP